MLYSKPGELLSREQLHQIEIPDREGVVSERWKGVGHGELADSLIERIGVRGLKVVREVWKTNPQGTDLFGSVDIREEAPSRRAKRKQDSLIELPDLNTPEEVIFSVGIRHSNLGRYAISMAVGGRVTVCENGMFTGEFVLKARHTKDLELGEMFDEGLTRYAEDASELGFWIADLRDRELATGQASELILRMGREEVLPWVRIQEVDREYFQPRFEEFTERNAWSLYNAATYVVRDLSGVNQMRALRDLKGFFSRN